ncbi:MAG: ATP-binding cassette domain-containing protein, partial [Spirochaetaceae bacterium]|nr:ATP-binding cassette domain-containing protein [Spirochaetaceae bacterium]
MVSSDIELPMITFSDARIPMGRDRRLRIADWRLSAGECWVIIGEGGSGKSSLARAIADYPGVSGTAAFISFDREKEIRAQIRRDDDSEWTGKPDEGREVEGFIGGEA